MKFIPIIILLYLAQLSTANADSDDLASQVIRSEDALPRVDTLNWLNQNFLSKQRQRIEVLVNTHFGRSLQGNKRDLPLLQRIIDENLIGKDQTQQLQALGAVLGDVYVNDIEQLQWKIFTDELGATHAVCIENSKQCIFVMTMLSRRMEVGLKPRVEDVYDKGLSAIKNYLPKLPYAVEKN